MEDEGKRFKLKIDPESLEESFRDAGERIKRMAGDHRYSKVRLSWRGKPLGPDIPLGLFIAGQAASFWAAGPLRLLLMNLGVGSIIDVELVNEADEEVARGRELFMDGEVEEAEDAYREALRMRPGDFSASYNLAVLLRVQGKKEDSKALLEEALSDPPLDHPELEKAQALWEKLGGQPS
jgi:tetratricopeptide (TPR) repeat protein